MKGFDQDVIACFEGAGGVRIGGIESQDLRYSAPVRSVDIAPRTTHLALAALALARRTEISNIESLVAEALGIAEQALLDLGASILISSTPVSSSHGQSRAGGRQDRDSQDGNYPSTSPHRL